jgi:hypothetical protein
MKGLREMNWIRHFGLQDTIWRRNWPQYTIRKNSIGREEVVLNGFLRGIKHMIFS